MTAPDYIPILVGGGIGVVGTLAGSFVSGLGELKRHRQLLHRQAALEVADTERLLPIADGNGYYELEASLQRTDALLIECGVPESLRRVFIQLSHELWADNKVSTETNEAPGFDSDLLQARRGVASAVRAELLGPRWKRRQRRAALDAAVDSARNCIPETSQAVEDSMLFW